MDKIKIKTNKSIKLIQKKRIGLYIQIIECRLKQ